MIWPFPLLRNNPTNNNLSRLFLAFANAPDVVVTLDGRYLGDCAYYAEARCSLGTLRFWIANEFYAWADSGRFTDPAGKMTEWKKQMPSRWAVKRMAKLVADARKEALFPRVI